MSGDGRRGLDTFTLDELMRLDNPTDFDQLDILDDPEASRLWWQLRRAEFAEEDAG